MGIKLSESRPATVKHAEKVEAKGQSTRRGRHAFGVGVLRASGFVPQPTNTVLACVVRVNFIILIGHLNKPTPLNSRACCCRLSSSLGPSGRRFRGSTLNYFMLVAREK